MSFSFSRMWSMLRPRAYSVLHPVNVSKTSTIRTFSVPPFSGRSHSRFFSAPSSSAPVSTAAHLPPKTGEYDAVGSHPLSHGPLSIGKRITAYCELSKLKLSTFVVITAGAGFSVAPAPAYDLSTLQLFGCAMLGTLLCSGCANTINQIREVKFDAMMKRTANRPLPSGLMTKAHAAAFAAVCGLSGTGLLYACVNPLTAALGAANILLYAGPYTSMKRTTIWNTWVGAIVGAVPPVMGWTAVTGSVAPPALLLAGILFSWQLPHFMSLACVHPSWFFSGAAFSPFRRYMARNDYNNGGYKMLSCSDPRAAADTAVRHALAMSAMLFALPAALQYSSVDPNISHTLGTAAMYGAGCSGLVWAKVAFTRDITMEWAKKTFLFSLLVVPIIMAAGAVWWLVFSQ
jgi:protoheme IX farnesyltransferase